MDSLAATGWVVALIAGVFLWEALAPHRKLRARGLRWPTSFALAPFNALLTTVVVAPVAVAAVASEHGWGLLNVDGVPRGLAVGAAVPLLDLVAYGQHRLLHAVPVLWSVHRVHHADVELDCTTGLRFHPIEALVTSVALLTAVAVLGLPPLGVAIYQALAVTMTVLEHANARVPAGLERRLQRLLVTPGMHRVHHSIDAADAGSNFATIFSVWDRWLGTYRRFAAAGDAADVGVPEFRDVKYVTLPWTLALPFISARRGRAGAAAAAR